MTPSLRPKGSANWMRSAAPSAGRWRESVNWVSMRSCGWTVSRSASAWRHRTGPHGEPRSVVARIEWKRGIRWPPNASVRQQTGRARGPAPTWRMVSSLRPVAARDLRAPSFVYRCVLRPASLNGARALAVGATPRGRPHRLGCAASDGPQMSPCANRPGGHGGPILRAARAGGGTRKKQRAREGPRCFFVEFAVPKEARMTGLEPATPRSTVWCANQLRHIPVFCRRKTGGGGIIGPSGPGSRGDPGWGGAPALGVLQSSKARSLKSLGLCAQAP